MATGASSDSVDRLGSKLHEKEVAEAVSVVEALHMDVVGFVSYVETLCGLRVVTTVWAGHFGVKVMCRFYKVPMAKIGQKTAHFREIQVNDGTTAANVDLARGFVEQEVKVVDVFNQDEMIDVTGAAKGKGFNGVVTCWGVTRSARKAHHGLCKDAGSWYPFRAQFQVPRSGQRGYYHRTETNEKIYRAGNAIKDDPNKVRTENDLMEKGIMLMGGSSHYGDVTQDWVTVEGTAMGCHKRLITLCKSLLWRMSCEATENDELKFIDTVSRPVPHL